MTATRKPRTLHWGERRRLPSGSTCVKRRAPVPPNVVNDAVKAKLAPDRGPIPAGIAVRHHQQAAGSSSG